MWAVVLLMGGFAVGCSSSIELKRSGMVLSTFPLLPDPDGAEEMVVVELVEGVGLGLDEEACGGAGDKKVPLGGFPFLSAASLFVLYSILFCSKLGSFKYSSSELASDTGACFRLGIGTLRRFCSFFATPKYSTTRSVCSQK